MTDLFDVQRKTAIKLLLTCLGRKTGEMNAARLDRLSPAVWEEMVQLLVWHDLASLFYYRLKTLALDITVPSSVEQQLRELYHGSAIKSVHLHRELARVLQGLKRADIPVITLKGAFLAQAVYRHTTMRPMIDVDLLVRQTDLAKAEKKLLGMGYGPPERLSIEEQCAQSHHLTEFTKPGAPPVEVHWTLSHPTLRPFKVDVDGLWQRARPAVIAGVNVLALSPEDLILYLCLHVSFHHNFHLGLKPFCDIDETIWHYRDEMDWERVQLYARRWGIDKYVYLTLHLVRELLGASVPDEVLGTLNPGDLNSQVVAGAMEQIFADRDDPPPLSPNIARLWEAKRLQDKTSLFLKSIFPSSEIMARTYSIPPDSPRIWLYYPVRLKDLVLRHGRTAWRLLRRDAETVALTERENRGIALKDWMAST